MVRQGCWRLASSSHPIQPDRASEWPNWRCVREEGEGRTGDASWFDLAELVRGVHVVLVQVDEVSCVDGFMWLLVAPTVKAGCKFD
uniref:Uncharacterized protein n=1 Tax=Oryza glumipatula TaxID=40148 RepID=A0A0E0AUR5_9ORYZ